MNWDSLKRLGRDGLKWGWHKVTSFWNSRGVLWKAILGLGAILTLINGAISLYDRFYGEPKSTYHTSEKWVHGGSTELKVESPPRLPTVQSALSTDATNDVQSARDDISFLIGRMHDAYDHGDYTNAVKFATVTEARLKNVGTNCFVRERLSILPVQLEEAFFNCDYAKVRRMIADLRRMDRIVVADTPAYRALADIAARLEDGKGSELFFFSSEELGRLRDWDRDFLEEYLTYLSAWGYLHPIMLDPRTRNHHTFYYEDFFGFKKPLPYCPRICVAVTNVDGNVVFSNEGSFRWRGRDRSVPVDVDECIEKALRLAEDEKYQRGIKLNIVGAENGRGFNASWSYSSAYKIPTNAVAKISKALPWEPGKKSPMTELNTVYLTRTNQQVVSCPYVPRAVWIVIFTLICMAFAPQGEKTVVATKPKALSGQKPHENGDADKNQVVLSTRQLYVILFLFSAGLSVILHLCGGDDKTWSWCHYAGAIFDGVIAGVIVAYLTGRCQQMNDQRKARRRRDAYLADFRKELTRTLASIVWFDSCLGDPNFNWSLKPETYWDLKYAMAIWATHPAFNLDYKQARGKLETIKNKHSPSGLQNLKPQDVQKVVVMYRIIFAGSMRLIELMRGLERDRVVLATSDMMSYEQNQDIVQRVKLALEFFLNQNNLANYGAGIDQIVDLLNLVGDQEFRRSGLRAWLN